MTHVVFYFTISNILHDGRRIKWLFCLKTISSGEVSFTIYSQIQSDFYDLYTNRSPAIIPDPEKVLWSIYDDSGQDLPVWVYQRLGRKSHVFTDKIRLKCYYTIFHEYSLPCQPVYNLCPIRGLWEMQPASYWQCYGRFYCGKAELPSVRLHWRLLSGHLCCHNIY